MSDPEQVEVQTKLGTLKASGVQTPLVVLLLAFLTAAVWFLHTEHITHAEALKDASRVQETFAHQNLAKLDTLIGVQCAIYRKQHPLATIPQCL